MKTGTIYKRFNPNIKVDEAEMFKCLGSVMDEGWEWVIMRSNQSLILTPPERVIDNPSKEAKNLKRHVLCGDVPASSLKRHFIPSSVHPRMVQECYEMITKTGPDN
jgi:hypothetical protein